MAWYGKIIEIFLSSPSDVQEERDLIRSVVEEWNQRRGRDAQCIFSVLTWEDSVTSELEDYAQGVINAQIGDTYDVMIGLMWGRFGSPTGKEESGTFEEFKRALRRKKQGDPVRISFYFKMADIPRAQIDPDQLKKVDEFKAFFQQEGGFTREFTQTEELRSQLYLLLEQIARDKDRYDPDVPRPSSTDSLPASTVAPEDGESESAAEIGVLDAYDRMQRTITEFASIMNEWTSRTNLMGEVAVTATEELASLAQFGNPPPERVREIVDKVTANFDDTSDYVELHSPTISGLLQEISFLIEFWISFLPEMQQSEADVSAQLAQLTEISGAMHLALVNNRELITTIRSLPRMTTKLSLAQKRISRAYDPFLNELEKSVAAVDKALLALEVPDTTSLGAIPSEAERRVVPSTHKPKRRTKSRRRRK